MRLLLTLTLAAALCIFSVSAAPASPQGEVYVQPDGTPVFLILKGDMHYSWMTDYDDNTVIKDYQKRWVYAKKMGGMLVSSGIEVGRGNPTLLDLEPNLKPDPDMRPADNLALPSNENRRDRRELKDDPRVQLCSHKATSSKPCTIRHLVVLVRFSDHATRKLEDPKEYELLFNHNGRVEGSETLQFGSVNDLFDVNSHGALKLETVVSPVWIQSSYTEAFAVSSDFGKNLPQTRKVWKEALEKLDQLGFDFASVDSNNDGKVDSMSFVHSGVGAERPGLDCKYIFSLLC